LVVQPRRSFRCATADFGVYVYQNGNGTTGQIGRSPGIMVSGRIAGSGLLGQRGHGVRRGRSGAKQKTAKTMSSSAQAHGSVSRPRHDPTLDVYSLLVAVFLFVSPWLFAYANGTVRLDFWITSGLIAAISAVAILAFSEWEDWLNLLLGLWLVLAPWLLGFAHTKAMHMSIAVGCLVAYLAGLELWLAHYGETDAIDGNGDTAARGER
jgi:hypothetical protein